MIPAAECDTDTESMDECVAGPSQLVTVEQQTQTDFASNRCSRRARARPSSKPQAFKPVQKKPVESLVSFKAQVNSKKVM